MTALEREITSLRSQAATTMQNMQAQVDGVRADKNLSDVGKAEKIRAFYEKASVEVNTLQEREVTAINAKKTSANTRIFGNEQSFDPGSIVAYRDAQDRADRLADQNEAIRMYDRAVTGSDRQLERAILQRALSEGWQDIVSKHSENHPLDSASLTEMAEAAYLASDDIGVLLSRASAYSLPKPAEANWSPATRWTAGVSR